MEGPIDYWSRLPNIDFGQIVNRAMLEPGARQIAQNDQALTQAKQQAEATAMAKASEASKQYQAALNAALLDPSVENYRRLILLNPGQHEAFKEMAGGLEEEQRNGDVRDLSAIRGHLYADNPAGAKAILERRIAADKRAGHDSADDEEILRLIEANPKAAAGMVDYALVGHMGVDKWGDAFGKVGEARRADAELPGKLANTRADTALKGAQADKARVEAELAPEATRAEIDAKRTATAYQRAQIDLAAQRLDLDRDTLESNISLKIEEMSQKGVEISAGSEKAMTDAVVGAETARALSGRAKGLAEKLATSKAGGGIFATTTSILTGLTGDQSEVTRLRTTYKELMTQQAIQNLPPGPASDKDIKLVLGGFPPPNASKETLVSFLNGMAKLQELVANTRQAQADWISGNGNIGRAKRDLIVNGVTVPAGTTFGEFSKSQAAYERREATPSTRSYMRFGG